MPWWVLAHVSLRIIELHDTIQSANYKPTRQQWTNKKKKLGQETLSYGNQANYHL
jgi:hypothetical protein